MQAYQQFNPILTYLIPNICEFRFFKASLVREVYKIELSCRVKWVTPWIRGQIDSSINEGTLSPSCELSH